MTPDQKIRALVDDLGSAEVATRIGMSRRSVQNYVAKGGADRSRALDAILREYRNLRRRQRYVTVGTRRAQTIAAENGYVDLLKHYAPKGSYPRAVTTLKLTESLWEQFFTPVRPIPKDIALGTGNVQISVKMAVRDASGSPVLATYNSRSNNTTFGEAIASWNEETSADITSKYGAVEIDRILTARLVFGNKATYGEVILG